MRQPAWKDMTVEKKCELLQERCAAVTRKIEAQEAHIGRLDERLRAAEARIEEAFF
jgi:hypothetical protein